MRKCFWAILSVLLLLVSVPVLAQYDTSHHDLRTYDGSTQSCSHCHGRIVTAGVTAQVLADAGQVGGLCLGRCHALTGIYTGTDPNQLVPTPPGYPSDNGAFAWNAGAADYRAVLMGTGSTVFSHGRDKGLAGTNRSGVFPYDATGSTGNIECTSCHSVHDDTNAPFIWRPLFTAPASHPGNTAPLSATTTTGLCDTCHRDKADLGGTGFSALTSTIKSPAGNHPVDFAVTSGTVARNVAGTVNTLNTGRHARLINIDFVAYGSHNVWDVPASTVAQLRTGKAANWVTGGKMGNGAGYTAFTSGTSVMGCATCHSAHRTVTPAGLNNLVNVKFEDTAAGYNPICVGCHGSVDVWATDKNTWNVGGTAFGHPVGDNTARTGAGVPANTSVYVTSVGNFSFNVYNPPATPWQAGANGEIMCSSCHDIHNAIAGSMAIRNLGQTTTAVVCKACHNGVGFPNITDVSAATPGPGEGANAHHRTSSAVAAGQYTPSGEAPITIASPTWNGKYALGQGNIATGMDCADCHVFNGTAHNW